MNKKDMFAKKYLFFVNMYFYSLQGQYRRKIFTENLISINFPLSYGSIKQLARTCFFVINFQCDLRS